MVNLYHFSPTGCYALFSAKRQEKSSDSPMRLHKHAKLCKELVYVDYGKLSATIGSQEVDLNFGDAIIISNGQYHTYHPVDNLPYNYLNIMFRGTVPETLCNRVVHFNSEQHHLMCRIADECEFNRLESKSLICCLLNELFIELIRQEKNEIPPLRIKPEYRYNFQSELAQRAVKMIEENYRLQLKFSEVAKRFNVSESHLQRILKAETGKTFSGLMHLYRIDAAKYLLRLGTMTPKEVATAIGYLSVTFFFRLFKRKVGKTPMEYARSVSN